MGRICDQLLFMVIGLHQAVQTLINGLCQGANFFGQFSDWQAQFGVSRA